LVEIMVRLLLVSDLMGFKHYTGLICYLYEKLHADSTILLGNTISPSIVRQLVENCNMRVYGVLGRYDNASLASILIEVNGLLECKSIMVKDVSIYGYGLSGCEPRRVEKIDILVSSIPGRKYTCCTKCSDMVDRIIEYLKPRLIITGGCSRSCQSGNTLSPGRASNGFIGLLNYENGEYVFNEIDLLRVVETT